jgi:ribosomal protein S18 acetylase RimI-like enzyme
MTHERTSGVWIREATLDDQPEIARLYAELGDHHRRLLPEHPRYQAGHLEWEIEARKALENPDISVHVAEADEGVVAFMKIFFLQKSWGLSCEVETLVVEDAWRGTGVGTMLMARADEVGRAAGAKGMRVDVLLDNARARAFYEGLDYSPIAIRYGKPLED